MPEFVSAVLAEMDMRRDYLSDPRVDTLYFGGGTPTLLDSKQLALMIGKLRELFRVAENAEITLEANPDDLTPENLKQYRDAGFNRISVGTQSFFDDHLQLMNRRHDARQAIQSIEMASAAGFASISLDLIYGIPGMTLREWKHNLTLAAGLPVDHISAYHLTIEPNTRFGRLKKAGRFSEISDKQSVEQYELLTTMLEIQGFEHYEISNFARNGAYSRHNSKYWSGDPYLGLGPSAHSFNGTHRHWNVSGLTRYLSDILERKLPRGEAIDDSMRRNEYVMTRLRTNKGIDSGDFKSVFGNPEWYELLLLAEKHLLKGNLVLENGRLFFTREAWFQSDGILADLFEVR